jgi:hypothetical protein
MEEVPLSVCDLTEVKPLSRTDLFNVLSHLRGQNKGKYQSCWAVTQQRLEPCTSQTKLYGYSNLPVCIPLSYRGTIT